MLLAFLAATAIAIVRLRNLFAVVMLSGLYSLLSAAIFVILDAVDVAFTEAAVGAGITTVLLLGTLVLTDREEKRAPKVQPLAPCGGAGDRRRTCVRNARYAGFRRSGRTCEQTCRARISGR